MNNVKLFSILVALAMLVLAWANPVGAEPKSKTGSIYIQTNGVGNEVIRYVRASNGKLTEAQRISTGGAGSGTFKPITGQASAPNAFEGVGSIIITPDGKYLFTTNGGNNSVSTFRIGPNGALTLVDTQPTGQAVSGKSGTAKSLAYAPTTRTLYVGHSFGPDHVRMFSVDEGRLMAKKGSHTVNTGSKTDRVMTQIVLTPDGKYLMANILFDKRPGMKPDGTPDLAVANTKEKDGLVIFPVKADGDLGAPRFTDGGGGAPFVIAFLHDSNDTFINGLAAAGGLVMGKIDKNGNVTNSPVVKIGQGKGMPTELCWISITPDNKQVFASVFGYSYVSSYRIKDGALRLAKDPAAAAVPGDGTFKALDMLVSSGPNDSWISPDGKYFYQMYPNASNLIAYRIQKDGGLKEIETLKIPYNSPQGMAGI